MSHSCWVHSRRIWLTPLRRGHPGRSVHLSKRIESAGNAAVAFMFLFQFFFGALSSSVPWTYQNEVFPVIARARGTALATATNYFTNFWLGLYIPQALNDISWKLYFIFGAINLTCCVIGYLFFPETAGKTLEELDLLFLPHRYVFVFRDKDACSKQSTLQTGLVDDPEKRAMELRERILLDNPHGIDMDGGNVEKAAVAHEEKSA